MSTFGVVAEIGLEIPAEDVDTAMEIAEMLLEKFLLSEEAVEWVEILLAAERVR